MIKLIIKFNMHLAVESLAGKENKKTCWKLVQVLWDSFVHFSGTQLRNITYFLFSNSGFWLQKSGYLFGLSVPLPNTMCLLLELLISCLLTQWKGFENISNDGCSQYCDGPSMETISQPFHSLNGLLIIFFYTSEYLSLIHVICFSQFSYAVDRDGASPARDYPKPWLDFLNAEGCVRTYLIHNITRSAACHLGLLAPKTQFAFLMY